MKQLMGKKQLLLAVLVVALGAAVYLNYYFSLGEPKMTTGGNNPVSDTAGDTTKNLGDSQYVNGPEATAPPENPEDYFVKARANRKAAREEALDIIEDLLSDVKNNEQIQQEALARGAVIAAAVEQESKIESLIVAKGFADCVVYIEGEKCSIVVRCEGLTPVMAVQITDIVTSQSNVVAQNVNIVTVK